MEAKKLRPRVVLAITGTLGDFYPFLATAIRLREYGLEPVLAAMEEYREAALAEGIAFQPVRPGNREMEGAGFTAALVAKAVTDDLRAGFNIMLPHLDLTLDDLVPLIASADFVIGGPLSAVARILAEAAGVPMATILLQPMGFLSVAEPPAMREVPFLPLLRRHFGKRIVRMLYAVGSAQGRSSLRPLTRLRVRMGLSPVRDELVDGPLRSERIFAMYPEEFAPLPSDAPPQAQSTGFTFYDGSGGAGALAPELESFLESGPPPLVFTLGSFLVHAPGDFYRAGRDAAEKLGRRAILLVGQHAIATHAHLASDTVAVAGYAPHSLVFPRAAAVVHHGGIGTAAQALRAGVPQLVCPLFGDQFDNAARLRRLGVAESISLRRFNARRAGRALNRLLTSDAASRARALAPSIARHDGPSIIAHWVANRLVDVAIEMAVQRQVA